MAAQGLTACAACEKRVVFRGAIVVVMVGQEEPGSGEEEVRPDVLDLLRRRLVRFGASRSSQDVAEDLAQETLLLLTTKYPKVTRLVELLPLSITIMRLKIRSHQRKAHRRGEDSAVAIEDVRLVDGTADPHELLAQRQALDRLKMALAQLGARCAELYRLKLEGKGFAEIGTLLGAASVNTVYSWEFRCRQHLRKLLDGPWVPEEAP